MMLPIIILAGGLATRLRPLTETIPKALIDVNGEPFIAHQLRLLREHNIQQVTLCLGYLGEMVVDYVGDGRQFDLHVTYSFDGPHLLGTAGAIKKALPLAAENFFVVYGDSYLTCDYAAVQHYFLASQKLALMTVFQNDGQWDTSNVEYNNNQIIVYDKQHKTDRMHYIDYGLGLFNSQAFAAVSLDQPTDLAGLYQQLLQAQQLAAFEITERFYEVGSFTGMTELSTHLTQQQAIKTF